jgi:hypothetical protein
METLSELKAKMNKQRMSMTTLPINEKQKILSLHIEDTQYGIALKIETEKYYLTTRYNIDLLSSLSEEELNSITGFNKVDNYQIEWEGEDENLINRLNFRKRLVKFADINSDETHVVKEIKIVKTKYGNSMLIETDNLKFYKNIKIPTTDTLLKQLIGEKFKVNKESFEWL